MKNFSKIRGQSAIEYLMTYGWMLLVIAIVGGAIFSTVSGQCIEGVSGISPQEDLVVERQAPDQSGNLQMSLSRTGSEPATVENITVTDGTESIHLPSSEIKEVSPGSTENFKLNESGSINTDYNSCAEYEIRIVYSISGFGDNLEITGTLTDKFEIISG